ncbi:MAG: hypothetical protein AAB489_00845 [Patescibacteria group bacterium]
MSVHGKPKPQNLSTLVHSRMNSLHVKIDPSMQTLCVDSLVEIGSKLKELTRGTNDAVAALLDPYIQAVHSICKSNKDHHRAILALNEYFVETVGELEQEKVRANPVLPKESEMFQDMKREDRASTQRQQNTMNARVGRSKKPKTRVIHRW